MRLEHDCGCVVCERNVGRRLDVVEAAIRWHRTRRHVIEHPTWDTNEHAIRDCEEMDAAQHDLKVIAGLLSTEAAP